MALDMVELGDSSMTALGILMDETATSRCQSYGALRHHLLRRIHEQLGPASGCVATSTEVASRAIAESMGANGSDAVLLASWDWAPPLVC